MPCDMSMMAVVFVCSAPHEPTGVGVAPVGPPLGFGIAPPGMWTQPLLATTAPNRNATTRKPRSARFARVMVVTVGRLSFTAPLAASASRATDRYFL